MPLMNFPRISLPVKLSIVGASIGIALISALAVMLKRRRKKPPKALRDKSRLSSISKDNTDNAGRLHNNHTVTFGASKRYRMGALSPSQAKAPNGDIMGVRQSVSPGLQKLPRSGSTSSIKSESATSTSTLIIGPASDNCVYSPEQLCDMGLECLQMSISHWEHAVERIDDLELDEINPELELLQDQLHHLIGRAYHMRDHYEQKFFRQASTHAAMDAVIHEMDREYEQKKRRSVESADDSSTDQESFVSALDMADLSDLDKQTGSRPHLALYQAGLLELTHGSVPCRSLRTRCLEVPSDTEFLSKLHCVRLGYTELFMDETLRKWFSEMGRQLLTDMLIKAEKDPEEFHSAFDEMMDFIQEASNWEKIEQELRGRGVKAMTFFDIVLDFILFDAFDDLENPPSSVTTVVRNRWLSNGFKETALATAVWSVLKAKRRMLKFPKGFIAHFYAISEIVSPVLAWGFLGPEGEIKDICYFFKDQVMNYMRDVFSFEKARYTTVEQLTDDIVTLTRHYAQLTSVRLSS